PSIIRKIPRALFSLLFPDECRICQQPLADVSRIPVCAACLKKPIPITAEYFCLSCKTPFQNRFPLEVDGRCLLCRSGSRGFDEAFCFGSYEDTLRELIHIFKYGGVR